MCWLPFILQVTMSNKGNILSCHLPTGYFINLYLQYVGGIGYQKPNSNSKQSLQQAPGYDIQES